MPTKSSHQEEFDLENCRYPLRLAFTDNAGFPRIASLWYKFDKGNFYCVTHKQSWIVSQLQARANVGYEIASNEPPYKGVRGIGTVKIYPLGNDPLLEQLLCRYTGNTDSDVARFLLNRRADEWVIELTPLKQTSWDYSERMSA